LSVGLDVGLGGILVRRRCIVLLLCLRKIISGLDVDLTGLVDYGTDSQSDHREQMWNRQGEIQYGKVSSVSVGIA
jgi:hypothetical protein